MKSFIKYHTEILYKVYNNSVTIILIETSIDYRNCGNGTKAFNEFLFFIRSLNCDVRYILLHIGFCNNHVGCKDINRLYKFYTRLGFDINTDNRNGELACATLTINKEIKKMEKIIVLIGMSGTGKSTIERKLKEIGIQNMNMFTTRTRRIDDDKHLTCVNEVEFKSKTYDYDFFTDVNNSYYGYKLTDAHIQIVSFISGEMAIPFINKLKEEYNVFTVVLDDTQLNTDIRNAIKDDVANRAKININEITRYLVNVEYLLINRSNAIKEILRYIM